jgi:hypothetical protein
MGAADMICKRQFEPRARLQRWQVLLVCFLACTLALFFVTRFVDFSGSSFTFQHLNPTSGVRSVAQVDQIHWIAPKVDAVVLPAAQLLAREPLPSQPLNDDLYNRPPPSVV